MKITLGVPFTDKIYGRTVASLMQMVMTVPSLFNLAMFGGPSVCTNRNMIVKQALKDKTSHILFVDSDMIFDFKDLKPLLDANKDIIGASYHLKEYPLTSSLLLQDENGRGYHPTELPPEPFKCFAIGTGFLLVKTSVFENIEYPWFWYEFHPEDIMTEDVYFCIKAAKAGYEIWCDPKIKLGHIGLNTY